MYICGGERKEEVATGETIADKIQTISDKTLPRPLLCK